MEIGDILTLAPGNATIGLFAKKTAKSHLVESIKKGGLVRLMGRPGFLGTWAYGQSVATGKRGYFMMSKTVLAPKKVETHGDRYLKYLHDAFYANPDRQKDYIWGAEGQNADGSKSGDPEWDCSGLRHASLRAGGVKDSRTNADGYMRRGHKISAPTQVGDFGVLKRSNGTAHHIVMWVGGNYVIEAKGAAYGIEHNTLANLRGRGVVWYRDDKVNKFLATKV